MHVNINKIQNKITQILQSRSMPRQYFLQTKESRLNDKGHLESGRPRAGSLPKGHCIFVMKTIKKKTIKNIRNMEIV